MPSIGLSAGSITGDTSSAEAIIVGISSTRDSGIVDDGIDDGIDDGDGTDSVPFPFPNDGSGFGM